MRRKLLMKGNKGIYLVQAVIIILLLFIGIGSTSASQSQEPLILKFGHVLAPSHPYHLGAEKFKEVLEKNAPSPVRVDIFPSSQLGSERDLTEGLQLGTIQVAIVPGTIALFEPKQGVFDMPFLFKDNEHAWRVFDGEIGEELAKDLPKKGLRLLSYWENGFRNITNNIRPINTPEDLRGIKIRVPENKGYLATFEAFGANVVTMSFGEVYTALQQGTIDAQENPLAIVVSNKIFEVQKYLSVTGHLYCPAQVIMSEKTWSSMSDEMKNAVMEAANEARDYERNVLSIQNSEYLEQLKKVMEVNVVEDVAPFREAAMQVWEEFDDQYGDLIDKIINY